MAWRVLLPFCQAETRIKSERWKIKFMIGSLIVCSAVIFYISIHMGLVAYMTWSRHQLAAFCRLFDVTVQKTSSFCEKAPERKQPAFKHADKPNLCFLSKHNYICDSSLTVWVDCRWQVSATFLRLSAPQLNFLNTELLIRPIDFQISPHCRT